MVLIHVQFGKQFYFGPKKISGTEAYRHYTNNARFGMVTDSDSELPQLPMELVNKILIMREPHENAKMVSNLWFYQKRTSDILMEYIQDISEIEATKVAERFLRAKEIYISESKDGVELTVPRKNGKLLARYPDEEDRLGRVFLDILNNHPNVEKLLLSSDFPRDMTENQLSGFLTSPNLKALEVWWGAKISPEAAKNLRTLITEDNMEDWTHPRPEWNCVDPLFMGRTYPNITKLILRVERADVPDEAFQRVQEQFPNATILTKHVYHQ